MQDMFVKNGGILLDNHQVIDIQPTNHGVNVVTNSGAFSGKKLVLTTGSWGPAMLHRLGVDVPLKVYQLENNYIPYS